MSAVNTVPTMQYTTHLQWIQYLQHKMQHVYVVKTASTTQNTTRLQLTQYLQHNIQHIYSECSTYNTIYYTSTVNIVPMTQYTTHLQWMQYLQHNILHIYSEHSTYNTIRNIITTMFPLIMATEMGQTLEKTSFINLAIYFFLVYVIFSTVIFCICEFFVIWGFRKMSEE